jgi:hypothetical protein
MQNHIRDRIIVQICLLLVCVASTWQLLALTYVPESPAQDFAKHIAFIVNFKAALLDGQWVPRLQLFPHNLPDLPLFQFYGWLFGALALPFSMIGCAPVLALALSVLLAKWVGANFMYGAGRLLGATGGLSFAATSSFLLSPYVLSNVLGRFAFPEASAHAVLCVLFCGLVRIAIRRDVGAVLLTGAAVIALALAHPIFLLYGLAAAVFFIVLAWKRHLLLLGGCSLLAGLLAAAFQWLPSFLVRGELSIDFASPSPFGAAYLTSPSGLFWFAYSLADRGVGEETQLYLTPGIVTIPAMIALAASGMRDGLARAFAGSLLAALIMSFAPFDLWRFAPHATWALQFPYRLLAFVAMFSTLGLCAAWRSSKRIWQPALILALVFAQGLPIMLEPLSGAPIPEDMRQIAEQFASLDYASAPVGSLTFSDGWLRPHLSPIFSRDTKLPRLVDKNGHLLDDNVFVLGPTLTDAVHLRAAGIADAATDIWLADADEPTRPLDGKRSITGGPFSVSFRTRVGGRRLTFQRSDPAQITLDSIDKIPGNGILIGDHGRAGTGVLAIRGATIFSDRVVELWLAAPEAPDVPVTEKVAVGPGPFTASITLPERPGFYMLVPSPDLVPAEIYPGSRDFRHLSISLESFQTIYGNAPMLYLPAAIIERTYRRGYVRTFELRDGPATAAKALVELPIAYSSLFEVTQRGKAIATRASDHALTVIETEDLISPIDVRFRPPIQSIAMTIVGVAALVLLGLFCRGSSNMRSKELKPGLLD